MSFALTETHREQTRRSREVDFKRWEQAETGFMHQSSQIKPVLSSKHQGSHVFQTSTADPETLI